MSDPRADLRAAVLTGTMESSRIEATAAAERRGPALYEMMPRVAAPLNLDSVRFLYRVTERGAIEPVREAGRRCRHPLHR